MTKTLDKLFHETLKDIYFAEKKILKGLTKMEKGAQSEKLKDGFRAHYDETVGQIERLEQVFKLIGKEPKGKTCDAIKGLLDEGEEVLKDFKDEPALDAGLIACAQAIEHYEIARYGTLVRWAKMLGHDKAVKLLQETLDQESSTDSKLSKLAEAQINDKALRKAA